MFRHLSLLAGLLVVIAAGQPSGAAAQEPAPAWPVADLNSMSLLPQRAAGALSNPAYFEAREREGDGFFDPIRVAWERSAGERRAVTIKNRYGARLSGQLYRSRTAPKKMPGVVILPGFGAPLRAYESLSQQLADHGYLVLAVAPQGHPESAADPDPSFCGENGDWGKPQEAGLVERGPCAGQDGPYPAYTTTVSAAVAPTAGTPAFGPLDLAAAVADFTTDPEGSLDDVAAAYDVWRPRFAFAGVDAATWLLSDANPWRSHLDGKRLGIAGHSAGADGAVVAGNADFSKRFDAVVAWDSFGRPPQQMPVRVPTLLQQSERPVFAGSPWGGTPPNPTLWPSYDLAARFRAGCVPTGVQAIRGASHGLWLADPDAPDAGPAEHLQAAAHQTIAWFDHFVRGRSPQRLIAERFDDTVDRTSIGTGTYDPVALANRPPRIAGRRTADFRSQMFASSLELDPDHGGDRRRKSKKGPSCPDRKHDRAGHRPCRIDAAARFCAKRGRGGTGPR